MSQIYNSDNPIITKKNDRFNRDKFSQRIAQTIIDRNNNDDGLVLGLYGVWGEGKTSILNMIEEVLTENNEIIIIKFNPWRFKSEDDLILNFLKNLSEKLDYELNNISEKIGDFIKKFGSIGGVINLDLSKVGESLSDINLEKLKNRVNEFLIESEKRIVIIIDDIDRLDKNELFSIFKLIKLTGNFSNTYYILSFDDEMVASALSERYGGNNESSGYNFLEKIVQVPLRIPKALNEDLLYFTFELIEDVIKKSNIDLSEEEITYVANSISSYVLPKITTPRLAIRYANSLSFLIPLLIGEVNYGDLILFEAIKIFYPDYYKWIKENPEFFTESYLHFSREKNENKIQDFRKELEELNSRLNKKESTLITKFLQELFPYTKEALENHSLSNLEKSWTKNKRIASADYFPRYFIYNVPTNQISDVYFDNYIKNLKVKKIEDLIVDTKSIIEKIKPLDYLGKISFYENDLDWESKKVLINLILSIEERFKGRQGGKLMFSFINPRSQAAITIRNLISSHSNYEEKLEIGKYLISDKVSFKFSEEILRWFSTFKNEEDRLFLEEDLRNLNEQFLRISLLQSEEKSSNIFIAFEDKIFTLLSFWYEINPKELYGYIENLLEKNPMFIKEMIFSLATTIISSTYPDPYKVDFKKETYTKLKLYYDVDKMRKLVLEHYKNELDNRDEKAQFFDMDQGQDDINAMKQFLHWYDDDMKNNKTPHNKGD